MFLLDFRYVIKEQVGVRKLVTSTNKMLTFVFQTQNHLYR